MKYGIRIRKVQGRRSLPTRGAWIEIPLRWMYSVYPSRSLPTRGAWIEIPVPRPSIGEPGSLPTRGAWIEIQWSGCALHSTPSLPTRGAWIEIMGFAFCTLPMASRSPHGERGLKLNVTLKAVAPARSLPTRGAWIEILCYIDSMEIGRAVAPHTGSVD